MHKTYFISDTKEGLLDHRLDTTFFAFFLHICCPSEDFSEKISFTKIFLYNKYKAVAYASSIYLV